MKNCTVPGPGRFGRAGAAAGRFVVAVVVGFGGTPVEVGVVVAVVAVAGTAPPAAAATDSGLIATGVTAGRAASRPSSTGTTTASAMAAAPATAIHAAAGLRPARRPILLRTIVRSPGPPTHKPRQSAAHGYPPSHHGTPRSANVG